MADALHLELATPENRFVDEDIDEVELPGAAGYLGVLPGHAPLLGVLGPGVVTYTAGGQKHVLAIDGGFVEVFDNHVSVLADHAEEANEIQADAARRDLESAQEQMRKAEDEASAAEAVNAVNRAQARIDAAERH